MEAAKRKPRSSQQEENQAFLMYQTDPNSD
jgi:hypothetical protein